MTEKKEESNRRRKWAPKARTGCRTCKTRHVKCDETKPTCRRCHLSGFRCDGYPDLPKKDGDNASPEDSPDSAPADGSNSLSLVTTKIETTSDSSESPTALTPLIIAPTGPYLGKENHALNFFVNMTAVCVGRSRAAPHFWRTLVPQAAYTYPSVRHALLATAIANESLINRESTTVGRKSSELQVFSHTSKAIRALLTESVPVDVVLLTSATLGIMDLFNGHWVSACTHVTSGAKLAKQARLDPTNNPYISFYCEAFASALPSILKRAETGAGTCPPEKNSVVRLNEAVQSLKLAQISFEKAIPRVQKLEGEKRSRILYVLKNAKVETIWLLERWQMLLREQVERTSPPDDELEINLHRVESPFSTIMTELNVYLERGGVFDIARFEVVMERTMPFYGFAKAGPNVKMREDAAELMYLGSGMRGRESKFPASGPQAHRLANAPKMDEG